MSVPSGGDNLTVRLLTGLWTRLFIWGYFVTMATLAIWTLRDVNSPWPTLLGIVLFAGVCLGFTVDTGGRLSLAVTLLAIGVGVLNALTISWQLIAGGHSQWYYGAATVSLFYVGLRRRLVLAWVGFGLISAIILLWGATSDVGLTEAIGVVGRQVPILVVGTLFATGLRRTGIAIASMTREASRRATAEAAATATVRERARRIAVLDRVATPLLERLVELEPLSADERLECALTEAELRDGLRARGLVSPHVARATREARARGVTVVLLDDSVAQDLTSEDRARARSVLVNTLASTPDGRVTARLLPPGRDNVATIIADGSTYSSVEIPRRAGHAPAGN